MRTANPALNDNTFTELRMSTDQAMTLNGTVNKTGILLFLVVFAAGFTWRQFKLDQNVSGWIIGGLVAGLILALITVFKKEWAPVTAPLYAVAEGLFLGALSAYYNAQFQGIVFQAITLTFGTLFALLFVYRAGLIRVTENFRLGIVAATGGIFLVYLVTMVLGFFGVTVPFIHQSGIIGIGFSLFVVVIAALNLVLDFDFIEKGVEHGAPKFMEWYGAFGLIVTLVWLYLEILRLLAKLRSR